MIPLVDIIKDEELIREQSDMYDDLIYVAWEKQENEDEVIDSLDDEHLIDEDDPLPIKALKHYMNISLLNRSLGDIEDQLIEIIDLESIKGLPQIEKDLTSALDLINSAINKINPYFKEE